MTVNSYLHAGIKRIDGVFGEGYAKANPELLAAFIQACAKDFNTSTIAQTLQHSLADLTSAVSRSKE